MMKNIEKYINTFYDFIDKIGKHNFILIIFVFIVFLTTSLYQTFSLYTESEGLSILNGKDTYSFILDTSNNNTTATIAAGSSKNIDITIRNESDIPLKYGLYSSKESDPNTNLIFGYSTITKYLPNGIIPAKTNYIVTLKVYNYSEYNQTIDFGVQYGFNNEEELTLDNNQHWIESLCLMKKLFNGDTDTTYFATYRSKITEASFVDLDTYAQETNTNVIAKWNISATNDSDDSVTAWITKNSGATEYKLYIGAKNKIYVEDLQSFFSGMSSLSSINFDNLDTSLTKGMERLFKGCTLLSNIDVSSFDTSNVINMFGMFYNCSSLENLDLSNFNTSKVKNMGNIFSGCTNLKSDNLNTNNIVEGLVLGENFNTANVLVIGGMFDRCSNLTNLKNIINNFDTSAVTNFSLMFSGCSKLEELDLSHFDTSNAKHMESMFSGCTKLKNLQISNFDTSNVVDMTAMFSSCSNLNSLDISNFNTSNVTAMQGMFNGCSSLIELDLSNFNTINVADTIDMFKGCSKLENLNLSNFDTRNVTDMTNMFRECSSLVNLQLGSKFNGNKVTSTFHMFYDCSSLESLDLRNFNTPVLTDAGAMFSECQSLMVLDIRNIDTTNVTNFTGMFYNCKKLLYTRFDEEETSYFKLIIKNNSSINPTYSDMFSGTNTTANTYISVYYTTNTKDLVENMVNTKSPESKINIYPLLSAVEPGKYVKYVGNNGCTGNSCEGYNANYEININTGYCYNSNNQFSSNGWRLAYVEDGSAHLISAGAPNCMCTEYSGESKSSDCGDNLTSLLPQGGITSPHFINANTIALKYCNINYAKGGVCVTNNQNPASNTAWAMNAEDFRKITNKILNSNSCFNSVSDATCGYNNDLINNGSYYWYMTVNDDNTAGAFLWHAGESKINQFNSKLALGVRPVLALDPTVIVTGGAGTSSSPYTIDNFK